MVFASYACPKTVQHLHLRHQESSKRASQTPQGALYESKMLVQDFSGFLELSWALVASLGPFFGALLGSLGLSWGSLGALFGRTQAKPERTPAKPERTPANPSEPQSQSNLKTE